jgi:hypothetical protein
VEPIRKYLKMLHNSGKNLIVAKVKKFELFILIEIVKKYLK